MILNKNLIAKISNGFGNQMFLYAASYAFSKKMNYNLLLDVKTGINTLKKIDKKKKFKHYEPKFELNIFKLSANIASDYFCFDGIYGYLKKKIYILLDKFSQKKRIVNEIKNDLKKTSYSDIYLKNKFHKDVFIDGHFESEKYFNEFRDDLLNEFTFNKKITYNKNFLEMINSSNSVSIAIRRDRYSEFISDDLDEQKINKTLKFENLQYDYIKRSINFLKNKIDQPKFFIFSDNFKNLDKIFPKNNDLVFINTHILNQTIEDFYLMSQCKHYIVAPTSFHWWAAWLIQNPNKICLRPKDINPSNNIDFWPDSWLSI